MKTLKELNKEIAKEATYEIMEDLYLKEVARPYVRNVIERAVLKGMTEGMNATLVTAKKIGSEILEQNNYKDE